MLDRLKVPAQLPGAEVPDIKLPSSNAPRKEVEEALNRYFPPLPELPADPRANLGPDGRPLTLVDLQRLALDNSPVLRQAAAEVESARGLAIQAGLYPNPRVGYEGDTIGQASSAGMQGGWIEQTIKTGGKLQVARAAAYQDVLVAEFKLMQAEADLRTQVRNGYFNVLVAKKNLEVTRALAKLTDEIYKVNVLQLRAGEVAVYEPMQVRVLALQTRSQIVLAYNRQLSAWKQLAATLGLPGMPLTELEGQIDMPIPRHKYEEILAKVLTRHTDVGVAQTMVNKAQLNIRLAQLAPLPDVDLRYMAQKDNTTPPFGTVHSVVVGVALPLFDRNQGNLRKAQADLRRATEEGHRVRADLTSRVAEAFERYQNNRVLLEMYRTQMLPNQVQAFRAVVTRHFRAGERGGTSYNDLIVAEQTLVGLITNYVNILKEQWMSVVDLAGLMQTAELFESMEKDAVEPVPSLDQLCPLPCDHPCGVNVDPRWLGGDGSWPDAFSASERLSQPPQQAAPASISLSDVSLPVPPPEMLMLPAVELRKVP